MYRFIPFFLIFALLLTGCSMMHEEYAVPDQVVTKDHSSTQIEQPENSSQSETPTPQSSQKNPTSSTEQPSQTEYPDSDVTKEPPADAYSPDYKGPSDRNFRAVIYDNIAYYECDPYERNPWQPHIYSIALGEKTATDLLKGELIGLADSVLIGKTATHFCAMNLTDQQPKWIEIGAADDYIDHLLLGNTLYLYHSKGAYIVDLPSMKVEQGGPVNDLRHITAVNDEIFYLTVDSFYLGDPLTKSALKLSDATDGEQFFHVGDLLILYQDGVLPRIYNCKTRELTVPKNFESIVGSATGPYPEPTDDPNTWYTGGSESPNYLSFLNGIVTVEFAGAFGQNEVSLCYDLVNDCEVSDIETKFPGYLDGIVLNDGYLRDTETNRIYYLNDKKYTVALPAISTNQKDTHASNEKGALQLNGNGIYTVSFSENKSATILHYEQSVTQE